MQDNKIPRRSFLKATGAALAGMALPFKSSQAGAAIGTNTVSGGKFWINPGTEAGIFPAEGRQYQICAILRISIWAKVDGWWQKYQLAEYDDDFFNWFVEDTFKWYDIIFDQGKVTAEWRAPHSGISTYGNCRGRGDSRFHLNSAFKSVTIAPKVENLDYYLGVYKQAIDFNAGNASSVGEYSLDWKKNLLRTPEFWDRRILITTDLYSNQNAKTVDLSTGELDVEQTFGYKESHYLLNTMVNPVANFLYLDSFTSNAAPTWELRGIVANTHWNNPDQDEATLLYQKYRKAVLYPHMLQHGRTENHIGVVFHIVEQFDNKDSDTSPGRGVRVVPPGFKYLSHAEYNLKRMAGKV